MDSTLVLTADTHNETTNQDISPDDLSDVTPIPGGVPIRHVPHETLLLNLAEEHGFRDGFCMWAEALIQVYDDNRPMLDTDTIDRLAYQASTLLGEAELAQEERYSGLGRGRVREFAASDTPLRTTLREMFPLLGIVGTAKRLGWDERTVIGWGVGPGAVANWHGWVVMDRLVSAGCALERAARFANIRSKLAKSLLGLDTESPTPRS